MKKKRNRKSIKNIRDYDFLEVIFLIMGIIKSLNFIMVKMI